MTKLEEKLTKELITSCDTVFTLTGERSTRFLNNLAKDGAVKTLKRLLSGNRPSDTFDTLADRGLLVHSIEAVAVKGCYSSFFTDEEINGCLERLVDAGFYG